MCVGVPCMVTTVVQLVESWGLKPKGHQFESQCRRDFSLQPTHL